MTDTCAVRQEATRELAGPEPELLASALALSGCDRFEIVIGRYETESAGVRFDSWPEAVRRRIEAVVAEWQARNPTRALRAVSSAATPFACVMVIHHAQKG